MIAFARSLRRHSERQVLTQRVARCIFLALAMLPVFLLSGQAAPARAVSPNIVISQVYGGGGNGGAVYTNDFIELFNRGASTQSVTGWSVQYASTAGTTWLVTNLSNVTIQPGKYYLVQEASGGASGVALPAADVTGTTNMSATNGKVALVSSTTALTGACPSSATYVDLVGYGTANCFEGGAATPALSATTSDIRAGNGCTDTDANNSDFATGAPNPRNSTSAASPCSAATPPTGTGAANPTSVAAGSAVTLTVAVTPGTGPTSTGITVSADLSSIGGSATQQFYDDGTNGDATAGDNTFSFLYTVPGGTSTGAKSLPFSISDAQSRSGSGTIGFSVTASGSRPSGTGAANPASLNSGDTTLLTVATTAGLNPVSGVTADLTAIGGSATQQFYDDGTHGDITAGDGTYSYQTTIPTTATPGPINLPATITDTASATGSATISLTIKAATSPTLKSAFADPGNTVPNATSLLVVAVVPGKNPTSTGITVTVNLSSIGGSATQQMVDDGTNGDVTAGDGVYSYRIADVGSTVANYTFPVSAQDAQSRTASTTIKLNVKAQPPTLTIPQIQGNGTASPYAGNNNSYTTSGIVTGITYARTRSATGTYSSSITFYLQDPVGDGDPSTSDGIAVYVPDFQALPIPAIGDSVQVTGGVEEHFGLTEFSLASKYTVSQIISAHNQPLPAAIEFNPPTDPTASATYGEALEGMRVQVSSCAPVVNPTTANYEYEVINPANVPGVTRVFQRDVGTANDQSGLLIVVDDFDSYSTSFQADEASANPTSQYGVRSLVKVHDCVTGLVGPLSFDFGQYIIEPQNSDPTVISNPVTVTPGPDTYQPLAPATGNNFGIASFNTENFFDTVNLGRSGEVLLNATQFQQKTLKVAKAIETAIGAPSMIGVEEIENTTVMDAIKAQLNADGYNYDYIFRDGDPNQGDDPRGIDVGLFYDKNRVTVNSFHNFDCLLQPGVQPDDPNPAIASCGEDQNYGTLSNQSTLFPRRPLVVDVTVKGLNSTDTLNLTVIVNHFKSKGSCTANAADPAGDCTSERLNEARQLAQYIHNTIVVTRSQPNVVALGDLNDFENTTPLQELTRGSNGVTFYDLATTVPADVRYGYVFDGLSEILDHVTVSSALAAYFQKYEDAHFDSDYPSYIDLNANPSQYDYNTVGIFRDSDHDPALATFAIPSPTTSLITTATDDQPFNVTQGTTITYTYTLATTTGSVGPVTFTAPVPVSLQFVAGSVSIDGTNCPACDPNAGFPIGSVGTTPVTVVFQAVVQDYDPFGTYIPGYGTYDYAGLNCTATNCNTRTVFNFVNAQPLAARIAYVKVATDGKIEWAAASESNELGYSLDAVDAHGKTTRLTSHIVPAHATLGQKDGLYSAAVSITAGTVGIYLNDVEPGGKTMRHGPYKVGQAFGKIPTLAPAPAQQPDSDPNKHPLATIALAKTDAALSIAQDGIYHLTYEALTAQGIDLRNVVPARIALSSEGKNVPLYVQVAHAGKFAAGDWIEFVGQARDDLYNGSSSYVLTARSSGKVEHLTTPPSVTLAPKPGDAAAQTVNLDLQGRKLYWAQAPTSDSPWTWALLENDVPQLADQTAKFDLPGLYNAGSFGNQTVQITLVIRGWGGYAAKTPDHYILAELAGVQGEVKFDGNNLATITLNVPASALTATGNSLRLRTPGDLGVEYDTAMLETIRVSYPQATALPAAITRVAGVRPFTRAADLQESITRQAGSKKVDYLIIAYHDFVDGVAPLAQQHRAEKMRVATVDVNAIYDAYSNGAVDPAAIQKFIAQAQKERGVKYVLLVGADSVDPRDFANQGDKSFIPAYHSPDTQGTRAPSDAAYADMDGDGLPDVAVGRLPVRSTDELTALVAKTVAFNKQNPATLNATFVTDPTGSDFAAQTQASSTGLPQSAQVTRITWQAGSSSVNTATAALIAQWQKGSRIINYVGHSNADVWADDVVLDAGSLPALANSNPALLAVWGCWAANYDRPGVSGLSESLLTMTKGGAAAVIASSTEVSANEYAPTSAAFYAALYSSGKAQRIGDALLAAKRSALIAHRDWTDLAQGLALLGDPAMHT